MNTERRHIEYLLNRLASGEASVEERKEVERLLSEGYIAPEDIAGLADLYEMVDRLAFPKVSTAVDDRFYAMLSREKQSTERPSWKEFFSWSSLTPKLAMAAVTLLAGLAAGYFLSPSRDASGYEIQRLSHEVTELREMMMLSLLETGSATERLRAVTLTGEMDDASRKVTAALIRTLKEDENINVRLAALEALKPYAGDSLVREALIRSISDQGSPLVQIALAELMVALQEKDAVREFEKLIESRTTPPEVKQKIQESLKILI